MANEKIRAVFIKNARVGHDKHESGENILAIPYPQDGLPIEIEDKFNENPIGQAVYLSGNNSERIDVFAFRVGSDTKAEDSAMITNNLDRIENVTFPGWDELAKFTLRSDPRQQPPTTEERTDFAGKFGKRDWDTFR